MPLQYDPAIPALVYDKGANKLSAVCCCDCDCCDGAKPTNNAYVWFDEMFDGSCGDCTVMNEACIELTPQGNCVWTGQGPTNACITDGSLTLTITCDGTETDFELVWQIDGTDSITFTGPVGETAPDPLDCSACRQSAGGDAGWLLACFSGCINKCDADVATVQLSFQPYQNRDCCEDWCLDSYQVEISGADVIDPDGDTGACGDQDCIDLNGVYVVDFVEKNATPDENACGNWVADDWCHWANTAMSFACNEDANRGFCEIHLYLRNRKNCGTEIIVELHDDTEGDGFCNTLLFQGWFKTSDSKCHVIDETMGIGNHCIDQNRLCKPDSITVRVSST